MLKTIRRRATLGILAAVTAICLPVAAQAGTINIIISNFDVTYFGGVGGGSIYDTVAHPGGNLNPAEADSLSTAVFEFDMVPVGAPFVSTPGNMMYGDLKIDGIGPSVTPVFHTGRGANGGGFGFDFFTDAGHQLRLGIDSVDLLLNNGVFFFTGTATVLSQNLPFALQFTDPTVFFSYTATLPALLGSPPTAAMGSGAFTISGMGVIPEPATSGLLLIAAVTGMARLTRRRRRN